VSEETRARLVREIDDKGPGNTLDVNAELEQHNPELLQMAHNFASGLDLHAMQGFALLYKALPRSAQDLDNNPTMYVGYEICERLSGHCLPFLTWK
jgi:hypothetical protein